MNKNFVLDIKTVFLTCLIVFMSLSSTIATQRNDIDSDFTNASEYFSGKWGTDSGSVYEWINDEMVCVSVHNNKYEGWINKVALKNFRKSGKKWNADQAIRWHKTGYLTEWVTAEIEVINQSSFNKIVVQKEEINKDCCKPQIWNRINY